MTTLPGEGGARPEGVGEEQEQRPETPTIEDLIQQRIALGARFAEIQRQKEASVKKQVGNREAVIAEDKRLVAMLGEAKRTLTFFEDQERVGLLTDPKDQEDLRVLKELITSLQQQREESAQKYDALMAVPEVKDEVLKDAYTEHEQRGLRKEVEQIKAELEKKVDGIYIRMEALVPKFMQTREDRELAEQTYNQAYYKLRAVIDEVRRKYRTSDDIVRLLNSYDKPNFFERLAEQRKRLGLFAGKDKAAIDYLLVNNRELLLKYVQAQADLDEAREESKGLESEFEVLKAAYVELILEHDKKTKELRPKITDPNIHLFLGAHSRMEHRVDQFADLQRHDQGTQRIIGKYKDWNDALQEPKNKVMSHLFASLRNAVDRVRS